MLTLIVMRDDVALGRAHRVLSAIGAGEGRVCSDCTSALEALDHERFDLVLVDRSAADDDALTFVRAMRQISAVAHVPVISLVSASFPRSRIDLLAAGVTGTFSCEDDVDETAAWLINLLALLAASRGRGGRNDHAPPDTSGVDGTSVAPGREVLFRLTRMAEYRDDDTGEHALRVARHSEMIAEELGLPTAFSQAMRLAAPLHDIGKVAVPDSVLLKPGRLSEDEMAVVRTHARIGEHILGGSGCELVRLASEIAGYHHERWDGSGYPRQVSGHGIPLSARIVAVADVFDAMTSKRSYKAAVPVQDVLDHILSEAGRHFDPRCAEAFVRAYRSKHAPSNPGAGPVRFPLRAQTSRQAGSMSNVVELGHRAEPNGTVPILRAAVGASASEAGKSA